MQNDFLNIRLFIVLVLLSFSTSSYATIIYSDLGPGGSGEWNSASTWDLPRVPINQDTIIIKANETVILNTNITRNDVLIIVRGRLRFEGGWLFGPVILSLNSGSFVVVETGGTIEVDTPSTARINIGGVLVTEWSGVISVNGPAYATENVIALIPAALGGGGGVLPPGYSTVLPIELLSFEAVIEGDQVQLFWASATETNNDFYTIERSTNATNWEIIGEITGAGTSVQQLDYSYIDGNPIPGISYYRLKQTDYDGQFEYFDPAVVLYEPQDLFKAFPNPTTDILQINTSSDLSEAKILIKDINGQVMDVESDTSPHRASLYLSNLQRGVYMLELVFSNSTMTKRIIKK